MFANIKHYQWVGLDFMLDNDGGPVLLEANRCSHMVREFLALYGHDGPFAEAARVMTEAGQPACLLWRRDDRPAEDEEGEGACWIGAELSKHLQQPPRIAFVEDNQEERPDLLTREGTRVRPASIFRWWYPLPWSYERSGVRVINPNAVWMVVRDKLVTYRHLCGARHFRVPQSFPVESPAEARRLLAAHKHLFVRGFVLKPRIGFGGHGVQVGTNGAMPRSFQGGYLLSERVWPKLRHGYYWDVRAFVMGGSYQGGILRVSKDPVTNVFQGGEAVPLERDTARLLEPAALEAVQLLDGAAEAVQQLPPPTDSPLLRVSW